MKRWLTKLGPKIFGPQGSWKRRIWLSIDQLGNVVLLKGDEDETMSSNAGKSSREGKRWAIALCVLLNWLDPGHCEGAIEHDEGKQV